MARIIVEPLHTAPMSRQAVELVERKGLGHPDTICDLLAEAISQELCRTYLEQAGRVLHYNIENAMLVAGSSTPRLGGGTVETPMRFVYGDHATARFEGHVFPIGEIAEGAARRWIADHLPLIDPARHIVFQNELRPGSLQLTDLFQRETLGSNDTCVGSGYAPLSETEDLVLAAERYLNSPEFKARHPETGQDIKVTAVRLERALTLTLSLAFVGARIPDERSYFERKEEIAADLHPFLAARARAIESIGITINTLDRPGRGEAGMYLTVLGTSADSGDGGEVGRGNRANGLNAFHRPLATGAVAGKNPTSNVGKIYNLYAGELARRIHGSVPGVEEVYLSLCSQIGEPIHRPLLTAVRVVPAPGAAMGDVSAAIHDAVTSALAEIHRFSDRLAREPSPLF